jgi:shikimate kinase
MVGSGKSTVGRTLAEMTGWPYLDNDELVASATGRTAPQLVETGGVDALHAAESAAFQYGVALRPPVILGVAAWIVTDPDALVALGEAGFVVWLRGRPETLRRRIGAGGGRRSEATSAAWLAEVAEERAPLFAAAADLIVDVDAKTPAEIAEAILAGVRLS